LFHSSFEILIKGMPSQRAGSGNLNIGISGVSA
jgi:hypothetical protein